MNAEQPIQDSSEVVWRKSSYSGGDGGECVEVAVETATVHVRDSKNAQGARLSFGSAPWAAFVDFAAGR
ncbi:MULTISPECIES: DUF397 domain-containing protein [Streptomyces]|uniref:DUF397 domain-containing protein n=2 Tax=Streptomyces TaxID=1883 RepID=A0A420UX87_9ACTN|nr:MULTISPECIES: DUF397 domain-containing protein [Streptomyces]KNE81674.1 hypothetical protein ADZ36_15100 [Streptomyces fradiae]OFA49986.1 DUF397 domain-containing protein [Streptomyces fradiae]PQM23576.1 DUF397 domain-containing protein [Streptomyces xinghaiensis]RKM92240.1 DUF397 domain-containing protein [Streptomyces xinghaiensis]RNC70211.1 DUF397 domain-containing protein [Streptomyces xinghaiensis]